MPTETAAEETQQASTAEGAQATAVQPRVAAKPDAGKGKGKGAKEDKKG
jgi:hypothetical protein